MANNFIYQSFEQCLELKNVSRETFFQFEQYILLLEKWNKKINLIGKSTINEIKLRHIVDSAQIIDYIKCKDIIVTDSGSGAGFPGLILSFLGIKEVHLIKSDSRKAAFLRQASMLSSQKIHIHNQRIEHINPFYSDVITARALAPLKELLQLTKKFSSEKTEYIFLKGQNIDNEIKEAKQVSDFNYKLYPSKIADNSWVVHIIN